MLLYIKGILGLLSALEKSLQSLLRWQKKTINTLIMVILFSGVYTFALISEVGALMKSITFQPIKWIFSMWILFL